MRARWLDAATVPELGRAWGSGKSSVRTGVSCSTTQVGTAPGPEPSGGFPSFLSEPHTSEDKEEASDSLVEVIMIGIWRIETVNLMNRWKGELN